LIHRTHEASYSAAVIVGRTQVRSWEYTRLLSSDAIRRCTATVYSCADDVCTKIRCIACRVSQSKHSDTPLETRSPVPIASQRSLESRRRLRTANMSPRFQNLYSKVQCKTVKMYCRISKATQTVCRKNRYSTDKIFLNYTLVQRTTAENRQSQRIIIIVSTFYIAQNKQSSDTLTRATKQASVQVSGKRRRRQ